MKQQIRDLILAWHRSLAKGRDYAVEDEIIAILKQTDQAALKPGVRILSNGRYMLNGKLIKESEAFL